MLQGTEIMNAKLLFAATLAVALASSYAVADPVKPLSRADVVAGYRQAASDGTLRKNDYDYDRHDHDALSTRTRAEVIAEYDAARADHRLVGPLRNRSYNPAGVEVLRRPAVARARIKADVVAARADGSLRRSDYDDVPVTVARRTQRTGPAVAPVLVGTASNRSGG
jgi:opacity protein-like surface antigen